MSRANDSHGTQYEAADTEVRLKYVRLVGDRDMMGSVFYAALLTALVHIIALSYLVIRNFHRYRVQRHSSWFVYCGWPTISYR
jgi:hypothetical protein